MSELFSTMYYVSIDTESVDSLFSTPDKIIQKNGKIYVNDWRARKLFTYSINGTPEQVLYRRGRGPEEYLQISDFDVDANGNIWVIDAQADCLLQYEADGKFIASRELPFEASSINCLDSENIMFSLAQWDESKYKNYQLVLTDSELNIKRAFAKREQERDSNFELVPYCGLHNDETYVFFHQPICDDVHCINIKESVEEQYHFDFGNRTVPQDARIDTEPYMDDFLNYTTLAVSTYIDENIIAGGVYDEMVLKSFILDRRHKVKYMQDVSPSIMRMIGIYDGNIIYLLSADESQEISPVPEQIQKDLADGKSVIAFLPLKV